MSASVPSPAVLRVGVFGGAFDPPHVAHRALAEAALSELQLDRLHILPTGQAWHKARRLSDAGHRLAMCERAFGDLPRVRLDAREIHREGDSFTVDSLSELAHEYPGARLYLLVGEDQLRAFKTWNRWSEILSMATLVVAGRAVEIGPNDPRSSAPGAPLADLDVPFVRLNTPLLHVSATAIRGRIASGSLKPSELATLVPVAVAGYISQHSLYQKTS